MTINSTASLRKAFALAAAAVTIASLAPVASAQSLSERIEHVAKSQARKESQSKGRLLGILLYTDLSVQFDKTPVKDVFEYLETALGINIVARYNDDRTGEGIDPETEISLDVTDKVALTIIEMVLDQCADDVEGCTWQIRDGFVEVGTKGRLSAAREVRYYPIRDLLFEPPQFDNAPDLDLDAALQQGQGGGGSGGGGGGGGGFGGGGGGGRGGGGGSGGGGGGSLTGEAGEVERVPEQEKIDQILELIQQTVEPEGWTDLGGDWASIRYYQGTLIISAPDFIHRQVGGYRFPIPRVRAGSASYEGPARFVTFKDTHSDVQIAAVPPREPTRPGRGPGDGKAEGESETAGS